MKHKLLAWLLLLAMVALPFVYAWYLYPYLPDRIPTHFGANGQPDQFGSRENIFIGPAILGVVSVIVYLLLSNIHRIDPKRHKEAEDVSLYRQFALFVVLFMSLLSMVILFVTSHPATGIEKLLLPLMGGFFAGMGMFMPRFQPNYFAGLRLPWTLDNDNNWKATHQLAGKVWTVGGIVIALVSLFAKGQLALVLFFGGLFIMVIIPVIYSYQLFRKGNPA
jgi:uncharacterized membrane protein